MRSKLWILTRVFLKTGMEGKGKGKKKAFPKLILIGIIMLSIMASIGIPFGAFVGVSYDSLKPIGQQGAILAFALAITSMTIFVFGIFYVLTVFYFSKDVEFLLPLPLKPYEILGAKFITVLLYEYLTEFVLLGPALIVYGIKSSSSIIYYLYSLIVFLTLPVIPLVMASIINMVIMRFTNVGRHKDALRIVGGVFGLFIGISINIFMQKSATSIGSQEDLMRMIVGERNSLVGIISNLFPSVKVAALAITDVNSIKSIENLIIFLIFTAAAVVIFIILAQNLYLKGVVGASEVYSKRKELTGSELDKGLAQSSAIKAYTIKELKILLRTPSYFINCVIMNFLWPAFLIIPAVTQKGFVDHLGDISTMFSNKGLYGLVIVGIFAVSLFISSSNGITSTAISREGQNIFINKYFPMRYKDQLIGKVLSGVILSGAGMLLILVLTSAVIMPPVYLLVLMILSSLIAIVFTGLTGIFIDLKFPKLNWDNEQKAVKQNLNLLINMFLGIAIAVISVGIVIKFNASLEYVFGAILVVFGLLDILLYYLLGTVGEKMFSRIEP